MVDNEPRAQHLTVTEKNRIENNIAKLQENPELRNDLFREIIDGDTAIFSMSKIYNSLLQWSYYADSHTGLCLKYNIQSDFCGAQLFKVDYIRSRHIVDIVEATKNSRYRRKEVVRSATTKSKAWSHEKEVRAIRIQSGVFTYPKTALTEIGFGLKTSNTNKSMVKGWVEQAGLAVTFFDMLDKPTNFGLHRKPPWT